MNLTNFLILIALISLLVFNALVFALFATAPYAYTPVMSMAVSSTGLVFAFVACAAPVPHGYGLQVIGALMAIILTFLMATALVSVLLFTGFSPL